MGTHKRLQHPKGIIVLVLHLTWTKIMEYNLNGGITAWNINLLS